MDQHTPTLLTKPSSVSTTEAIINALRKAKRVLIGTHEHPDGDAIGSSLALYQALTMQGKTVTVYIPDAAPPYLSFLPSFDALTTVKPDAAQYDVIVLLDYTQLYRTHLEADVRQHPTTIAIDHHHDNRAEARLNLIVPEAAATAHILTELFRQHNIPITQDIATCLLTGIFTDTGSFMHDSTTPAILELAAELMGKGARLSHIAHETYQKKDLPSLRIWGRALARVMVSQATGAAVSVITHEDFEECGATLDDLSGVVNLLNTLPNAQFALLLAEYEPGHVKGSFRSEPRRGVDVSALARRLGGGGHKLAAGFEVAGHLVHKEGRWRIEPSTR
jgi:phosphoesterase RecJ-like protein